MLYHAVNNRLGISLSRLDLPIARERILDILLEAGFGFPELDILELARECVGSSVYEIGCSMTLAPQTVDCSSFVKWLYGQAGIWLPRLSVQQRKYGSVVETLEEILPGDLVFKSRRNKRSFYDTHPDDDVGHVGIASGLGTMIHATNPRQGVVEVPVSKFVGAESFRGIRRYFPLNLEDFIVLTIPQGEEIEIENDIRWFVLKRIGKSL